MSLRIFHPVQFCLPFPAKLTNAKKILAFFAELPSLGLFILALHVIFSQIFFEGSVGRFVLKISFHFIFLFFLSTLQLKQDIFSISSDFAVCNPRRCWRRRTIE